MIEVRSVSKRFPDGTLAVEDFSLVLPAHKTTVFVGSSGSGKTTLLRMINRMVDPTAGVIEIDGVSVLDGDPVQLRRSIGYVMQNSGLMPHFTVLENVGTVLRLTGSSRREADARSRELLDTVGLDQSLADRYPSQLSGGQQQRVGVARGLAADPNTGAFLVLNGKVTQIGGTSWSAPVWAAFCALINEARTNAGKQPLGFLCPLIYPLMGTACFRDVKTGNNGDFTAVPGYDLVTGIGVPNLKELVAALS